MDFEQIRAFLNVASLKSFSEAGEKMFISQPSISARIKALEEELGVVLIDRSKSREPILTEAGRVFLDYAQALSNLEQQCRTRLTGTLPEAEGLINIGASTVPGTYILPSLLNKFLQLNPSATINLDIQDTADVIDGILKYRYDLGFVGLLKHDQKLKYVPLIEDKLVVIARTGMIVTRENSKQIEAEDLFRYHLILREKGSATRQLLEKKMEELDLNMGSLKNITVINSMESIKQAVREGLGVAVVSELSTKDLIQDQDVEQFMIRNLDLRRSLYLVYHYSRVLGSVSEKLRDFTIKEFTK